MDWLPTLLKHLAISRSVVGAGFFASAVLYFGPRIAPAYVDRVPNEWAFALVGALAFSASLLFFWFVSSVWISSKRQWTRIKDMFSSCEVSQTEVNALHALGENPSEPLNLESIDYVSLSMSRLEVLELVGNLEKKGLVSINPYGPNLISLTAPGRQRALEIQQASRKNNRQG